MRGWLPRLLLMMVVAGRQGNAGLGHVGSLAVSAFYRTYLGLVGLKARQRHVLDCVDCVTSDSVAG